MKKKVTYLLIISILFIGSIAYSQNKNDPFPKPGGDPHPELPINAGIPFIMFIGIIYGIYSLNKKNN
ncbi:hypothetical protein [Lutibacter sp.]|uniref:hypothetical protein n=1 Tax=Lutibacter sp. TaxID=1925666 RepID=UPI0034A0293E